MLLGAQLPEQLWPETVAVAVYLKNRLPNALSKITPYERLLKHKPTISHLAKFGKPAHVLINDQCLMK